MELIIFGLDGLIVAFFLMGVIGGKETKNKRIGNLLSIVLGFVYFYFVTWLNNSDCNMTIGMIFIFGPILLTFVLMIVGYIHD